MFVLWGEGSPYWQVALGYAFVGIGVGFAGTPASHSLTGSVPVSRAGMASGTADLQRDLGGAFMQSIFGALLTAGYAAAVGAAYRGAPNGDQITASTQASSEVVLRAPRPSPRSTRSTRRPITAGAKTSFLDGADWAYAAGIIAVLIGAAIVFFCFPKRDDEQRLLAEYHAAGHGRRPLDLTRGAPCCSSASTSPRHWRTRSRRASARSTGCVIWLARRSSSRARPWSRRMSSPEASTRPWRPSSASTSRPMTCSSRGSPSSDRPGATARSPGTRTPSIWSEVLGEARAQSRIVARYLAFMLIAGTIAAFGVLNGNSILIVGAMAVSPDLLPLTAACVGVVGRRVRLASRAVGTLAVGLALASAASFTVVTVLRAFGLLGAEIDLNGPGAFAPPAVNASTFVVAFAAGVAGMLAFETRASAAVGVAISVTTIPAAAYLGVSTAVGDGPGSLGAFQVLLVNVTMLLLAGTLTLAIQRRFGRAPAVLTEVARPRPAR